MMNPYIICGPPGTGKTTTLIELILQILKTMHRSKIIVAAQSNSAADEITHRLVKFVDPNNIIRLVSLNHAGRPGGIPKNVKAYACTINDLNQRNNTGYPQCLEELAKYRIVIATLSSTTHLLETHKLQNVFTHALIDEAGQCTEPSVLVAMALVGKNGQIVLAGDPMQMPPLVFNQDARTLGLSVSMIERLTNAYENIDVKLMNQSYVLINAKK